MHRKQLGGRFGRTRPRALIVGVLWLSGAGLATAVWATQDGEPAMNGDALARVLKVQKIRDGVHVGARLAAADVDEHQAGELSAEQMMTLAGKYERELDTLLIHAQELRANAYKARDIIRLAFIDDRMAQLTAVIRVARPYFEGFHTLTGDILSIRSHFSLVQEAIDRARTLVAEMERCLGEDIDRITASQIPAESPNGNEAELPHMQEPTPTMDRPPEASVYR